ncbi:MAG TPA: YCF48-related protein [Bacteroidia bacterium]|nr:YCF48-related protein [Bacteroidia bacterium]
MKTRIFNQTLTALLFIAIFNLNTRAQSWWKENPQTLANFNNINFVDNNTGWALADSMNGALFIGPVIKKTVDQGVTWTNQSLGSNYYQLRSSHFFSTTNGIVVGKYLISGNGAILTTTNGGNTWTPNDTLPVILNDVFFINATTGWICGQNGYIIKTTNGGATWTQEVSNSPDHLFSIHFADANNGWAVGPNGVIVHTVNGGTTWTLQTSPIPSQDNFSVFALSATSAFVVGSNGLMIKTINSGVTWTTVTVPTVNHIFDITFVTSTSGWAVGAGGDIEITNDGGTTWTTQPSNTTNDIESISMKSTGLGWYAGKSGTTYIYGTSPASINELYNSTAVTIYPNPFTISTTLQIDSKTKQSEYVITIYNVLGKQVMEKYIHNKAICTINRENLENGIYIYKIEAGTQIIKTGKLIIQ